MIYRKLEDAAFVAVVLSFLLVCWQLIATVVQLSFLLLVELSKIVFPFVLAVAWHFVELISKKMRRS
jgi:hypothetical protein